MARTKKISEEQYVLDCINKEFELVGSSKRFDTFQELSKYTKENPGWFDEEEFNDEGTYAVWLEYCKKHTYDWKPLGTPKVMVEHHIGMFALNYGFPCRYKRDETTEKKEN